MDNDRCECDCELGTISGMIQAKIDRHLKKMEKPEIKEKDIFDYPKSKTREMNVQKRPKLFRKCKQH